MSNLPRWDANICKVHTLYRNLLARDCTLGGLLNTFLARLALITGRSLPPSLSLSRNKPIYQSLSTAEREPGNNPPNPSLNFFFIGVRRSVDESRHFARRQNTEEGRIQETRYPLSSSARR